MNDLERAALALVERPPRPPTPLESIERRADSIRRRRRSGGRLVAVAAVLAVLAVAAAALTARDSGQNLRVAGPTTDPGVVDLALDHRVSDPQLLVERIRSRYIAFGHPDVQVAMVGDFDVRIEVPGGLIDEFDSTLGLARGGFEVRPVLEALGDCSTGGSAPDGSTVQRSGGPDGSCYRLGPAIDLGRSGLVASSRTSPPPVVQLAVADAAAMSVLDLQRRCEAREPTCPTGKIAVTSMLSIVDPDVSVASGPPSSGETVSARISVDGFSSDRAAAAEQQVLSIPLPEDVTFAGGPAEAPGGSPPTTGLPSGAEAPSARVICLQSATDDSWLAAAASALEARFTAIGRTVQVAPYDPGGSLPAVGCSSGQALSLTSTYGSGDAGWVRDQIALLAPGIVRSAPDGLVLHPVNAVGQSAPGAGNPGAPTVSIELPADEYDAVKAIESAQSCAPGRPCWPVITIDGVSHSADVVGVDALHQIVVVLPADAARQGALLAALVSHPLPDGVSFAP